MICLPSLRRLASRTGGVLALLLQLAVAGGLPLMDGWVEAEASGVSHIEEYGRTGCPPAHDLLECQVCRAIRAPFSGGHAVAELPPTTAGVLSQEPQRVVPLMSARVDVARSRAPPGLVS